MLDGARSTDREGPVVEWRWTRLAGSGGVMALRRTYTTKEDRFAVRPGRREPLIPGSHELELVVVDAAGHVSRPARVTVKVTVR